MDELRHNHEATATCPVAHGAPGHVPPERVCAFDYRGAIGSADAFWQTATDFANGPEFVWTTALGGHWLVGGAEAVADVWSRPDLFTNDAGIIPKPNAGGRPIPASLNPPEHGKYRRIMTDRMFSVRAMGDIENVVGTLCAAILDEIAGKGACDFVSAFARRMPVDVFLTLMGVPLDRREAFMGAVESMFRSLTVEDLQEGYRQANGFIGEWIDQQLAAGTNGSPLFVAMLEGRIDGRPLSREEMHSMALMLFLGGLDTVGSQLTHVGAFLATHPQHRQHLIDHPEDIPAAVEELLRRFGIANIVREVAEDVTFRGVDFRKGDLLLLSTPLANLDARAFPDPLAVRFDRGRNRHQAFGTGIHLCVGAYLARVELKVAITQMLARLPGMRLEPGFEPELQSGSTILIRELPMRWDVG